MSTSYPGELRAVHEGVGRRAFVVFVFTCTLLSGLISGADAEQIAQGGNRQVVVDVSEEIGRIRSLQGTNGTPIPQGWVRHRVFELSESGSRKLEIDILRPSELFRPSGGNVSEGYRKMGIDMVRIHDWIGSVGDIDSQYMRNLDILLTDGRILASNEAEAQTLTANNIFPDWNSDPNDPDSYNFGPTDRVLKSIVDIGAEVFFRVGRGLGADAAPPRDYKKYAQVVANIVRHYNHGWADGFKYNIRYWEIWNEPDGEIFWSGTPDQYFALYGELAKAIKSVDPKLQVGGPALSHTPVPSRYRDEFVPYIKQHNLPLDFFSWHLYSGILSEPFIDPLAYNVVADRVRSMLDANGFKETQIVLSEWNYWDWLVSLNEAERAAFIASTSIYMQDGAIDLAMLYRLDANVKADGETLDKVGQAYALMGQLRRTPIRLRVAGGDDKGFAVLAGRSVDRKLIQLMISNFQNPASPSRGGWIGDISDAIWVKSREITYENNRGYNLSFRSLPEGRRWILERFRIGPGVDSELLERREIAGNSVALEAIMPPPGIEFIVLRQK